MVAILNTVSINCRTDGFSLAKHHSFTKLTKLLPAKHSRYTECSTIKLNFCTSLVTTHVYIIKLAHDIYLNLPVYVITGLEEVILYWSGKKWRQGNGHVQLRMMVGPQLNHLTC